MWVICDSKDKEWCPYGSERCECDVYYPHKLEEGEDRNISCTDINDNWQECYLEEVKNDKNFEIYEEILSKLREECSKCDELFNIAYELNGSDNTRTAFSQKVTSYMPEVMQTLDFLIGKFEKEEIEEQISEDAAELETDYDVEVSDCVHNCSTCKNNVEFPPPHTCDICTSLDQDEEYGMWEAKE